MLQRWIDRRKRKQAFNAPRTRRAGAPCMTEPLEERVLMAAALARGGSGFSGTLSTNPTIRKQQLICDPPEPMEGSSSTLYDASMVTLSDYRGGPGYRVSGVVEIDRGNGQGTFLQPFDGDNGFFTAGPAGRETGYVQVRYTLVGESGQLAIQPGYNLVDVGGVTDGVDTHELIFELRPAVPMTAPNYMVFAAADNSHSGNEGDFMIINNAEHTDIEDDEIAPAMVSSAAPPRTNNVYVSSSSWKSPFLDFIATKNAGSAQFGYRSLGAADLLPWTNVDTVTVELSGPLPQGVVFDASSVKITSAAGKNYSLASASIETGTHIATLRFAQPIAAADRITLSLDLDANFGSDRDVSLSFSPADVNRSGGAVNASDAVLTRNRIGRTTTNPGTGAATYDLFNDVNGDGIINASDAVLVRNRIGSTPPAITAIRSLFTDLPVTRRKAPLARLDELS